MEEEESEDTGASASASASGGTAELFTGVSIKVCTMHTTVHICKSNKEIKLCLNSHGHDNNSSCSLVPRLLCMRGRKKAWYTLFAHVPSSLGKQH